VEDILLLNKFCEVFSDFDICLSCEDIAQQSCATVPRWRFLATFLRPVLSRVLEFFSFNNKDLGFCCWSWKIPERGQSWSTLSKLRGTGTRRTSHVGHCKQHLSVGQPHAKDWNQMCLMFHGLIFDCLKDAVWTLGEGENILNLSWLKQFHQHRQWTRTMQVVVSKQADFCHPCLPMGYFVSDIAIFVLKRTLNSPLTNSHGLLLLLSLLLLGCIMCM